MGSYREEERESGPWIMGRKPFVHKDTGKEINSADEMAY